MSVPVQSMVLNENTAVLHVLVKPDENSKSKVSLICRR